MAIDFKESISDPVAVDVGNHVTQGRIVSKTIQLASFTTNENAVWAAKHQLQKESYPFAFISVPVNRDLFRLQVGDCFKFSYSKYNVSNMISRVLQVEEENLESEKIIIHAMEDVFGVSNTITEYSDPTGHAKGATSYDLTAFTHQKAAEALYVFSSDIKVIPLACREEDMDLGFDVYLSIDEGASYLLIGRIPDLKPYGTLVGTYPADTYTIDEDTGFTIDFVKDVSLIETVTWSSVFTAQRNNAILGNEIISFKTITPVAGTQYKLEDIIRGRFGTQKVAHVADEEFWFLGGNVSSIGHSEILAGVSRKFKLVPYNIRKTGDISEATVIDLSIEGESKKPYIPINFHANGGSFAARYSTDVALTWSPRYRGKGAGIGVPGEVLSDTDREGYFEIEVWVSAVKVRTADGIDGVSWTYSQAMNVADNVDLPATIEFRLLNYRTEENVVYESDQIAVVCKKGEGAIHIIPEGEPEGVWEQVGYSWAKERWGAVAAGVGNDFYAGLGQDEDSVELSDWWKFDSVTGAWTQKTSFPGGVRAYSVAVECGGKIYVGTGYTGVTSDYAQDWWEYDPSTDIWTQKTDFGGGQRTKAMAAEAGGKIYIGMGFGVSGGSPSLKKDWWEYDPVGDAWVQKADFSTDRSDAVAMGAGGKVYFGTGGVYPVVRQKDWWEYDPATNIWTQKGDFSGEAKTGGVIAEAGGKLYFGLGMDKVTPETGTYAKDWWEYTPGTDTWVQKADFGYWSLDSRDGACAAVAGGQIFVGLGRYSDKYKREWREYDIGTDTWVVKTFFGDPNFVPRSDIVAASAGGKVYAGTGNTGVSLEHQWWEYDSTTELWSQKADFGDLRMYAVAAAAAGKVYLGTGIAGGSKKDWWEYDPSTNLWTQMLDFGGSARHGAVAVELGDKIYVGLGFSSQYEKDWWEYDPSTNLWAQKTNFGLGVSGRSKGVAAEVDGRIFVGLGSDSEGPKTDWWEYSSTSDLWIEKASYPGVAGKNAAAVGLGGYVYVGLNGSTEWWRYSPVLDTWVQVIDFTGGRRKGAGVVVLSPTEVFVVAGYGETYPGSDVWEKKNDCWVYK